MFNRIKISSLAFIAALTVSYVQQSAATSEYANDPYLKGLEDEYRKTSRSSDPVWTREEFEENEKEVCQQLICLNQVLFPWQFKKSMVEFYKNVEVIIMDSSNDITDSDLLHHFPKLNTLRLMYPTISDKTLHKLKKEKYWRTRVFQTGVLPEEIKSPVEIFSPEDNRASFHRYCIELFKNLALKVEKDAHFDVHRTLAENLTLFESQTDNDIKMLTWLFVYKSKALEHMSKLSKITKYAPWKHKKTEDILLRLDEERKEYSLCCEIYEEKEYGKYIELIKSIKYKRSKKMLISEQELYLDQTVQMIRKEAQAVQDERERNMALAEAQAFEGQIQ